MFVFEHFCVNVYDFCVCLNCVFLWMCVNVCVQEHLWLQTFVYACVFIKMCVWKLCAGVNIFVCEQLYLWIILCLQTECIFVSKHSCVQNLSVCQFVFVNLKEFISLSKQFYMWDNSVCECVCLNISVNETLFVCMFTLFVFKHLCVCLHFLCVGGHVFMKVCECKRTLCLKCVKV